MGRPTFLLSMIGAVAVAACSSSPPVGSILDSSKVASVVVGRSSRADVFAALGRPARTETSPKGEAWVYATTDGGADGQTVVSGATSALGVAGSFVPYLGLAASSLGLASTAAGAARSAPDTASLSVDFGADGIVRDCVYTSTALPTGVTGPGHGPADLRGCRKPTVP